MAIINVRENEGEKKKRFTGDASSNPHAPLARAFLQGLTLK